MGVMGHVEEDELFEFEVRSSVIQVVLGHLTNPMRTFESVTSSVFLQISHHS